MRHPGLLMKCLIVASLAAGAVHAADNAAEKFIDDSTLTTKVKAALIADKDTKARQINVETHQGTVQLNGFVDSTAARAAAVRVARNVEGVRHVDDHLEIRSGDRTAGGFVDDALLTSRVKAALIADKRTKAHQIEVKSYKGTVSLGGFVDSTAAKQAAGAVAAGVDGVNHVDNGLIVK